MKTIERDDWRVQPAAATRRAERAAARQAFERALQDSSGEQQQGGREDPGRSEPARLLHELIAFLQRSLNSAGLPGPAALQSIARQIAGSVGHAVQSAQVGGTGCWRLRMRLPEELIALSEIDIACRPGQLRIALRTASADSYEQLLAARPELDRALRQRQLAAEPAQVVLIEPRDLS